jgi:hypothetical protein
MKAFSPDSFLKVRPIRASALPPLTVAAGERPRREARHAKRIVELWNKRAQAGRPVSFYPTVKTALLAGTALLEVLCPACQTIGSVDLRTLDIHDGASILSEVRRLSCRRCCPNPPLQSR